MKKRLSLICFAFALLAIGTTAEAQVGYPYNNPYQGGVPGGQVYEPGTFQPTRGDLQLGLPGRIWVDTSIADRGLGYEGSYVTLGAKNRLFQDALDGRWLGEMRLHHSLRNSSGFFANFGIERVFSLDAAGADVGTGFWVDYDNDEGSDFSNPFTSVGVSAKIKTRRWDLLGNGYFAAGTSDYTIGDPTGQNCFYQNFIVLQPAIDSNLDGFDVTLRLRPAMMQMVNGTLDLGGYGYSSDLVDFFGGGRVRVGAQLLGGLLINAEVNYDDRFDVTGVLTAGWAFGVNARNNEYAGLGRDLEETVRNDHIVRFQQDLILAIDPDTGLPYNVWHVNNLADAAFSNGTVENPFTTLADAEAASGVGDIIFVNEGNGTAFGMQDGIVLKDDQLFLGDGVQHLIPVQNGQFFVLCNDVDGIRPTISGSGGGNAVTLANNNVVRGFNIDGDAGVGGMANGIFGDGVHNGVIEDNIVSNAILHGMLLQDITGDWNINRNIVFNNGFDGMYILDACDPTSTFNLADNISSSNGRDGIHFENYDAEAITFLRNITDENLRHGIHLENFKNTSGNGLDLDILGHLASGNNGEAIRIDSGDGNLRLINNVVTNNEGGGLRLIDWTTSDPDDMVLVAAFTGGVSSYSNNAPGSGIVNTLTSGNQRFMMTGTSLNGNFNGLVLRTQGVGTSIVSNIVNNVAIAGNAADGINVIAEDGSTQQILIEDVGTALPIANNGNSGISFLAGNPAGGAISTIEAVVRNVSLTGNGGNGILIAAVEDGLTDIFVDNSVVSANGNGISFNVDTNPNGVVSRLVVNNSTFFNNGLSGIIMNTNDGSFGDLVVFDSIFSNTVGFTGPPFTNTTRGGGFGNGIEVNAFGSAALPGVDNRTRVTLIGNSIQNFLGNGVALTSTGDSSLFADFRSNLINQNGFGFGSNGDGTGGATLPFFDGINAIAFDDSQMNLRFEGNDVTGNFERGIDVVATGSSNINALWVANDLSGNDLADDAATIPPENNISDVDVLNSAGSTICLAMSSNFFTNGFNPINLGAVGDFVIELDGVTNGFGPGSLPGNITTQPFGTVCEAAIDAEELAFLADGFPAIID